MAKQIHYVVVVDLDRGTWSFDDDTLLARFDDEGTWNTDTQQWEETEPDDYDAGLKIIRTEGTEN